ncbi:MAG: tetratricopeptide repeat protein [Calditrichaeota bacterium]|nr:tetratricopeptide repeat protein [Calditrichota bacterium]MCB9369294.1 tetratricopeptide repeat protein [Calditrichota bacterium]
MTKQAIASVVLTAVVVVTMIGCTSRDSQKDSREKSGLKGVSINIRVGALLIGTASDSEVLARKDEFKRELPNLLPEQKSPLDSAIFYFLANEPDSSLFALSHVNTESMSDSLALLYELTDSRAHWQKGNYETALASADNALKIDPHHIYARMFKGVCLMNLDRREEALAVFDSVLAQDPEHIKTIGNKATCLGQLGRAGDAVAVAEAGLAIDPSDAYLWQQKGWWLQAQGKFDEALACEDSAFARDPKMLWAVVTKGEILAKMNRVEECRAVFAEAEKIKPGAFEIVSSKASCMMYLKQYDEAQTCLDEALKLRPRDAGVLYNMAALSCIMNNTSQASEYLEKSISEDSNFATYAKADPDFDGCRKDPIFRRLVGME